MDDNKENLQAEETSACLSEDIREDAEEKSEAKPTRSKTANIIQISLICLFGAVFLACIIYLVFNYAGKIMGSNMYEGIADRHSVFDPLLSVTDLTSPHILPEPDTPMQTLERRRVSGATDSQTGTSGNTDKLSQIRASISELKEQNPDVYGWIFVSDSDINYPIVKGTDNRYYLNHSIEKSYLAIGTIFADSNCKETITDNYNTVFYGHNVVTDRKGSSMFHDVTKFLDSEYFNNTMIYIYTMDGIFVYKPFSIYGTTSDHFYFTTEFTGEAAFLKFASDVKALSSHKTDAEIKSGDTIITLSTCTNGPKNARYALHAVLIDHISDTPSEDTHDTQ